MADGEASGEPSGGTGDGAGGAPVDRESADVAGEVRTVADPARPARLERWALATFAVVTFGLVLVLVGHLHDALAGPLSDLGTLPGVLLFGYLWALSVAGVRVALGDGGLRGLRAAGTVRLLGRGAAAGAVVGGGFVLALLLVVLGQALLSGQFPLAGLLLYGSIGTAIGALVGSVVGVVFAVVAAGFSAASDALVEQPAAED